MVKTLATKKGRPLKTVIKPAAETAPPKLIRYAADFSGLGATGMALRLNLAPIPELQGKHVWSCDKARACKRFIAHTDPADTWFNDITTRDLSTHNQAEPAGYLHLYLSMPRSVKSWFAESR